MSALAQLRADARGLVDHRPEHLVGVRAALHQELGNALADQLHRPLGGRMTMRGVDAPDVAQADAFAFGDGPDLPLGSDQDRLDQVVPRRIHRTLSETKSQDGRLPWG